MSYNQAQEGPETTYITPFLTRLNPPSDTTGMNTAGSINSATSQLAFQVGVAVAAKSLEAAKTQGDAAVSLLQQAAQMQQELIATQTAPSGRRVDVTA